jgi:hypothetical protein
MAGQRRNVIAQFKEDQPQSQVNKQVRRLNMVRADPVQATLSNQETKDDETCGSRQGEKSARQLAGSEATE